MDIIIVGAGLGGLSCAIGCCREGLNVIVLEKDQELTEFGAGIQLPPNAVRVMDGYGLLDKLIKDGHAFDAEHIYMRSHDGELLTKKPLRLKHWLGFNQYTIHRVDYQQILAEQAQKLGADLRFGCGVQSVDCSVERPRVRLDNGDVLEADIIIGADGLFSVTRTSVIGSKVDPIETGDLAWRATITKAEIEASQDSELIRVTREEQPIGWVGPESHVAFYPLRHGSIYNLVLARPDDLPAHVSRQEGDLEQMRAFFSSWDPLLRTILDQVKSVQKWKLHHLAPLDTWVRGCVALMGDACHPTLPYQAQGAAMAVEDGATIARLLGLLLQYRRRMNSSISNGEKHRIDSTDIYKTLQLYQKLRKERTELNVRGAERARIMLHLPAGPDMEKRDQLMRDWDWNDLNARSEWEYFDTAYTRDLLGFDAENEAARAFEEAFESPFSDK